MPGGLAGLRHLIPSAMRVRFILLWEVARLVGAFVGSWVDLVSENVANLLHTLIQHAHAVYVHACMHGWVDGWKSVTNERHIYVLH